MDETGGHLTRKRLLSPITALQRLSLRSMLFEHCQDGIAITDAKGFVLESNAAFTRIAGYRPDELLNKSLFCPWIANQGRTLYRAIRTSVTSTGYWQGEVPAPFMPDCMRRHSLRINTIQDELRKTVALIWTLTDETPLSEQQRELIRLAHQDPLTGLPNRRSLMSRLDRMLDRPPIDTPSAVLYVDLDGFKQVNDTLGHRAGDNLLQAVVTRINTRIRHSDMLARLGGDEFVIVLERIANEHDASVFAEQIIEQLRTPFELGDGNVIQIGASVGIALLPRERISAECLLDQADRALYTAKKAGKGAYRTAKMPAAGTVDTMAQQPEFH
ncbi:diguanylate cyclase [Paraburkholderia sp. RL17-383-BIF-A]|uniref:diguanylate cyclase domain-containing protein n=1 Tax=Paraburkholderia sp. RL17-383-BIF-A TaxID=3031631 RepID=UPI0038BBC4B0